MRRARAKFHRWVCPALFALLLTACAGTPAPPPAFDVPAWRGETAVATAAAPDDFLRLTPALRAWLAREVEPLPRRQQLHALTDRLLSPSFHGIRYDSHATLTAGEAFAQHRANCLSFSALAVAAARHLGFQAQFQQVAVLPSWEAHGSVYLVQHHVNARVRDGAGDYVIDLQPSRRTVPASTRPLPDSVATAHYHSNLGAGRLAADDLAGAYRDFRRGIELAPDTAFLWINLGVALGRNGQHAEAEAVYRRAVALEPEADSALHNLAQLYRAAGDAGQAAALEREVNRRRADNPYYQFARGERAYRNGDYDDAIGHYRRSLALQLKVAEVYFALALAQWHAGRSGDAKASLQLALQRSEDAAGREALRERFREQMETPRLAGRGGEW
jgi:tetratricopeptide (TPR) repeat protein